MCTNVLRNFCRILANFVKISGYIFFVCRQIPQVLEAIVMLIQQEDSVRSAFVLCKLLKALQV